MAMYALPITPLIRIREEIQNLREEIQNAKHVWFADDSNAAGRIITLRKWSQHLAAMGPKFGYHPNSWKNHFNGQTRIV